MKFGRFAMLFLLFALTFAATQALSVRAGESGLHTVHEEDVVWTLWDNEYYALIDDGDVMWIAGGAGLVQLDKASGDHVRWSTGDGLPHWRFYAGAVDGSGNRWFGGDGGLSKLDAGGEWSHYNTANSGLFNDVVRGIAVSANGDVWASHGGSAKISRLRPDGSWLLYPNSQTAVSLAFETIKQTINDNDLWTAAGDEVWIGYDVYDGDKWQERRPPKATMDPRVTRADSENHLFALDEIYVFEWDGAQWLEYYYSPTVNGELYSLAVDKEDVVWVGGYENYGYYFWAFEASVGSLPEEPGSFNLDQIIIAADPTTLLLDTEEGLWAAGSNWIDQPGGELLHFEDVPYRSSTWKVLVNKDAGIWITSSDYGGDAIQGFDDRGTATMRDDRSAVAYEPQNITALELAGNGDLWVATAHYGRFFTPYYPDRIHQGQLIEYWTPIDNFVIRAIFAEDAARTWFTYFETDLYGATDVSGLWSLDDGGTPANQGDDVWTTYDTSGLFAGIPAARDGRLWYGNDKGVYAYQEDGWEQISYGEVEALIPARDGVLFVDDDWSSSILVVEADGSLDRQSVSDLIENDFRLVRSTTAPNALWHVAPDGVVWFWDDGVLASYDGVTRRTYDSPLHEGRINVDTNNHLWIAGEGDLWRMSAKPDFQLSSGPAAWLMEANESRDFAVTVLPVEGFAAPVEVSLSGLPAGITAVVQPPVVLPGETAVVTLTAGDVPIGGDYITIRGTSGDVLHEKEQFLVVVEEAHGLWLPAVFNH